ncbi:hypothetical protein POTOM_024198 [Populus tomentosa]|uniref:RanBP2-type domain-containing protein n=1 Tax=Populus tomentosa TaxID=118781 RepID=A0A8X7ZJZ8_POPTO|nr:hypothetical protein POTOM_024198 [Populus tomentosa]
MSRPGDWNCRSCQHLNFQRRDSCQRCGDPRPGERDHYGSFGGRSSGGSFGFTGPDVRPGDWYCTAGNCGAHNFASRSSCFKCGVSKDESSGGGLDADMSRMRGPVATSTTLLAGLNAIDAMHQENLAAATLRINHRYRSIAFLSNIHLFHEPNFRSCSAARRELKKKAHEKSWINLFALNFLYFCSFG